MANPFPNALPSLRPPSQYGMVNTQPFGSYDTTIYESIESDTNVYPNDHAYYDIVGPIIPSTPSPPPPSPPYFGNEHLRQSIHPMMGSARETSMTTASPTYKYFPRRYDDTFSTFRTPGYSTAPVNANSYASTSYHEGYRYPGPQQGREPSNYAGIPETPTSPSPPLFTYNPLLESSAETTKPVEEPSGAPDAGYADPASYGHGHGGYSQEY